MTDFNRRLDEIESQLQALAGDDATAWQELRERFCADPGNAAIVGCMAATCGTRSLLILLRRDDAEQIGTLRRALGVFCQRERIKAPGATVIKVRALNSESSPIVFPAGDGSGLVQLLVCPQEVRHVES